MMVGPQPKDIVEELREAALDVDDMLIEDVSALLRRAADVIECLRHPGLEDLMNELGTDEDDPEPSEQGV